jgi:hypothetical protein
MNSEVVIAGDEGDAPGSLMAALLGLNPALTIGTKQTTSPIKAGTLILLPGEPGGAIAFATGFASAAAPAQERLVLFITTPTEKGQWPSTRDAATLAAFTRHAALAWAPLNIRVNGIVADHRRTSPSALARELACLCLAVRRWHSMTGQMLCLAGP